MPNWDVNGFIFPYVCVFLVFNQNSNPHCARECSDVSSQFVSTEWAWERGRIKEAQMMSHSSQIIHIYWETSSLMTTHDFQVNKYVPESILCYPSWNCSFWAACLIYPKAISRQNSTINKKSSWSVAAPEHLGLYFMPLGKLYLEVSRNTYRIKGVLFWRANTQWCGLWKSKLAANGFITCLFAISYFLPIPLWFKSFLLGTFPPVKWLLARPKLGCTILLSAAEWNCESRKCLWSQENWTGDASFLVFTQQEHWAGCSVVPPPAPGRMLSLSQGTVPPRWAPWLRWVLCCSSDSWLQKALSRASQGCWRQQLDKARIQD